MIHLTFSNLPVDEVPSGLSLMTVFENIRPLKGSVGMIDWRLNGGLSQLIYASRFKGQRGEALLMPTRGRLESQELMLLGMGDSEKITELTIPQILHLMVEKLLLKKCYSFCLSLSDLTPGMFEWRNTVRLFISMLSGRSEEMFITLIEDKSYIEDAKRRHMDFSYDVEVRYQFE